MSSTVEYIRWETPLLFSISSNSKLLWVNHTFVKGLNPLRVSGLKYIILHHREGEEEWLSDRPSPNQKQCSVSQQKNTQKKIPSNHLLRLEFGQALGHAMIVSEQKRTEWWKRIENSQVKEGELARVVAVLVHEPAGQVAAEDGPEIGLGHLKSQLACRKL